MRGYKALDQDMEAIYGNGMQFELGKSYSIKGDVIPCHNGFHFCQYIENLNIYYSIKNSRIFEIEADGEIIKHDDKYVAEKIRLVRELTKKEIKDYFIQKQGGLVKSRDYNIRKAVVEQGCGLDTLLYDEDFVVRVAVAEQGYGLDILARDENSSVRIAVAKQGQCLDILIYDEDIYVRQAVAKQGYGLDVLIHDEEAFIREEVAEQGYGLDRLIHDKNYFVRLAATRRKYRDKNKL